MLRLRQGKALLGSSPFKQGGRGGEEEEGGGGGLELSVKIHRGYITLESIVSGTISINDVLKDVDKQHLFSQAKA